MARTTSIRWLEEFGRTRLSQNFYMRDFLYSEIGNLHGIANIPDDPKLAIEAGSRLCGDLLEPLNATFGRIAIRSSYRSSAVNGFGAARQAQGYKCARNESTYASHIWDRRDNHGRMGATASIVVPWFADRYEAGRDWRALAWWIHDHLPYSSAFFFPRLAAFNLQWREDPERRIDSYIAPRGTLTKPGRADFTGDHSSWYENFPKFKRWKTGAG